jgi:hypothetical protein
MSIAVPLLVIFSLTGVQAFGSACLPHDFAAGAARILQGAVLRRAIVVMINACTPKVRAHAHPEQASTAIANNRLRLAHSNSLDLTISKTCCSAPGTRARMEETAGVLSALSRADQREERSP